MVLFKIRPKNVPVYAADCKLWAKEASRHRGFLRYTTLKRTNEPDQYASFYEWKSEKDHDRFMKKNHDRLVSLSSCPVQVLGYYNFKERS